MLPFNSEVGKRAHCRKKPATWRWFMKEEKNVCSPLAWNSLVHMAELAISEWCCLNPGFRRFFEGKQSKTLFLFLWEMKPKSSLFLFTHKHTHKTNKQDTSICLCHKEKNPCVNKYLSLVFTAAQSFTWGEQMGQ